MRNIITKQTTVKAALIMALIAFSACASSQEARRSPGVFVDTGYGATDFSTYSRFTVLDFQEGAPSGELGACSLARLLFFKGDVEAGAGESVADHIHLAMAQVGFTLTERSAAREAYLNVNESDRIANGASLAVRVAEVTGADAVVMGCVARFEELVGGKYSADKPAHVSFGVVVFDPARDKVVWAGKFDKMQRSLFEDLFQWRIFVKGEMTWQTADALSGVGAGFLVERMPKPKR
ncbi:MAG: hypothetical protein OEZ32_02300 [Nitrospinota bacterium]|nr:hypothetical protein [Nitrospinota bacterium]